MVRCRLFRMRKYELRPSTTAATAAAGNECLEPSGKPTPRELADETKWERNEVMADPGTWSVTFDGEPWFVIQKSTIPDAGNGLFAARVFERNAVLGRYTGRLTSREEIDATGTSDAYVLEYAAGDDGKKVMIDANVGEDHVHAGWVHMMNDAKDPNKTNAFFTSRGFARAAKKVNEGEELFVSYGPDYWCHEGWSLANATWIPTADAWSVPKCDFENERI